MAYISPIEVKLEVKDTFEEELIKESFKDTPEMIKIVKCESGFRQFKDGKPLMSKTSDVGVMQINQVHWQEAKNLGLDIFNSVQDNIKMGKIILAKEGLKAWMCYK